MVVRAAALTLLGLLHTAWLLADIPWTLKVGVACLLMLAAVRPERALLVWAGLAPLSTSIAGLAGAPLPGAALLEAMTLAVITGAVVRYTRGAPTRLALPAIWMSAVAVASSLAELPARLVALTPHNVGPVAVARQLFDHAVDRVQPLDPWYFALLVVEGAALAWAVESIVRRQPTITRPVVWFALLGHVAVGILNISRVIGASLKGGEFPASFATVFLHVREHTQYDVNAGASIFVMVALAALGLSSRRTWLPVALAVAVTSTALWIAGSRVAMAAFLTTLTMVLALGARRTRRDLITAGAAVAVLAGVIVWLAVAYPVGRNLNVSSSISSRVVLAKTALAMAAQAPVLGVGAGTFMDESPNYGAADLARFVDDRRTKDNAHNYFLQTVAEQGILGLLALLGILTAALWPTIRGVSHDRTLAKWLSAGIVASILTWLGGHPLLVPEAALVFWLFVGLLAGTSDAPPISAPWRRFVVVATVAILASVPSRALAERRTATLEHLGVGVSVWQPAIEGERYREAGAEFSLFLPSGTTVVLPIRSAATAEMNVELRNGPRLFDAVQAHPGIWHAVRVRVPESELRYLTIDFRVVATTPGSTPCEPCVWVGKAVPLVSR